MKILVTGGTGMVGRSLQHILPEAIYVGSKEADLRYPDEVENLFSLHQPSVVIHLAATVSGIEDNIKRPADHFDDNILMNTNVLRQAYEHGVEKFIAMLSTCIYPDVADEYPLTEQDIFSGPPTPTNFSYAYAKRAMAVQIEAYNKQFGTKYSYLIPCNIYGEYDNFNPGRSHYVAALIKKIYDAGHHPDNGECDIPITLLGTGKPLRQFIYSGDVARIIKESLFINEAFALNVAPDEVMSIDYIAKIALNATGYDHVRIEYERPELDGQYRKDCSNHLLKEMLPGFKFTSLYDGIAKVYNHYRESQENLKS